MDNDRAGHYNQRYKDGHIGKTVQQYNKKGIQTDGGT